MQEIDTCYNFAGVCTWVGADGERRTNRIEFIPVKYSWAELNRWTEILNRFAVSSGNTIGIATARIGTNDDAPQSVFVNGMTPFNWDRNSASDIRETILIRTYDVQKVVDALPVLLPLLGIPVDAVGVVYELSRY